MTNGDATELLLLLEKYVERKRGEALGERDGNEFLRVCLLITQAENLILAIKGEIANEGREPA